MNLWDSVHRGLEKASQEAARIAKIQRLRGNIDNLSRQIHTHHDNLLRKVLDLFSAGQLTQSELIPLCQELASLQQQLHMFQQELKQLQNLGTPSVQPAQPAAPIAPPPPEYHAYSDTTVPVPPPPPPSGEPLTVSAIETLLLGTNVPPSPAVEKQVCPICRAEVAPGNVFCHNCGSPVRNNTVAHLPTARSSTVETVYPQGQETIRPSAYGELATPPNSVSPLSTPPKDGGQ